MLRTEHLTKDYGRRSALDDVTLDIAPGEVFGLLGPNGSGKSTALRIVLGFLRPTSGTATVAGHDCWRDGVAARRNLAYLPGELRLYDNMTGRQLLNFLGRLRGSPQTPAVDDLARRFDIDIDRPLAGLSSGMKRKVALLQVLTPRVPLLIMDEPTNALDPTMRDELLDQVRQAKARGQTVLFSSHVMAEVEAVCDRVGILRRGKLVHLQALTDVHAGRLIFARWRSGATVPEPPAFPGLRERERSVDAATYEHEGPLPPLLQWLSDQPLADLRIEPLGLAAVYQRYHGEPA